MTTDKGEESPTLRFKMSLEGVTTGTSASEHELRVRMADAQRVADSLIINGVPTQMGADSIKVLLDSIPGTYDVLQTWLVEQQEGLKEICVSLALYGWAPLQKLTFRQLEHLGNATHQHPELVGELMSGYVRDHLVAIENELLNRHEKRTQFLLEAFQAHRMGTYSLSIPAFIIQADGICHDRLRHSVFIGPERTKVSRAFDANPQSGLISLIQPLLKARLPFWMTDNQRGEDFDELNRHMVLHGESTTYNTEVFSLKAIAFLNWLNFSLEQLSDVDIGDLAG